MSEIVMTVSFKEMILSSLQSRAGQPFPIQLTNPCLQLIRVSRCGFFQYPRQTVQFFPILLHIRLIQRTRQQFIPLAYRDVFQRNVYRLHFFIVYHRANRKRTWFLIISKDIGERTVDGFHFVVFNLEDRISCPMGKSMGIIPFDSPLYAGLTALHIHSIDTDGGPVQADAIFDWVRMGKIIKNTFQRANKRHAVHRPIHGRFRRTRPMFLQGWCQPSLQPAAQRSALGPMGRALRQVGTGGAFPFAGAVQPEQRRLAGVHCPNLAI